MTHPREQVVQAATDALRQDAQTWRFGAGELDIAQIAAAEMDFQAFHFSYIGDKVGLTQTYGQLQEKMIRLLQEGAANFRAVADALTLAANAYDREERNAEHRLGRIY
jgi:hypothetical protein